jgi:hypothetical protein
MTKSQNKSQVGDMKSPPLRPVESGLRYAADQAAYIPADASPKALNLGVLGGLADALNATALRATPPTTCKQILWFSFFFDGTGNNLDADEAMLKHSNVAKLFRVHRADDRNGVYPLYIPGVGTYFPAIGDEGGSSLGLGSGSMGQERLDYALGKFDEYLSSHCKRAESPSGAIVEVNIAVFGFSRGAALARAFINLLLETRCSSHGGKRTLNNGKLPVRIRFMGLFDTVASVGLPMSTNTTSLVAMAASSISYMIVSRLQDYRQTRPEALAFSKDAKPGADPAPGKYDGHSGWGGRLWIDEAVEEVRHFVAAHEIRNSFPLDSVSILRNARISKPEHFYETVYPGVHSDVGGSYSPGEGARGDLPSEKLGLIPLIHMYKHAILRGVPLLPKTAWSKENSADFEVEPGLLSTYNYYLAKVGAHSSLGQLFNKHMGLYYAWRFRAIRIKAKGDKTEAGRISLYRDNFRKREASIDAEIAGLEKKEELAVTALNALIERRAAQTNVLPGKPDTLKTQSVSDDDIQLARHKKLMARDELLKAKARKSSLPNMQDLLAMLGIYDKQLLADVQAIREIFSKRGVFGSDPETGRRSELRPHYKVLVEAYENEFEKNRGLADETIIKFFDNYVHDSLAAFGKDATIPSDPRVVYLGGDEKYEYARLDGDSKARDYFEVGIA